MRQQNRSSLETLEVLRRGAPLEKSGVMRANPLRTVDNEFETVYREWLASGASYEEIASRYGALFRLSEELFKEPDSAAAFGDSSDLSQPNIMAGLVGGDTELALLELFQGWRAPDKPHRLRHHNNATIRINRETSRIGRVLHTNRLTQDDIEEGLFDAPIRRLSNGASSIVTAEGIRFVEQIHTLFAVADMAQTKTSPPNRGIKNALETIKSLASANIPSLLALEQTDDHEVGRSLGGSVLESETLIVMIVAAMKGYLKSAWPIAASQRLDYGFFRHKDDLINTDLLCVFPTDGITVPLQVHGHADTIAAEAERVVVIHKKDLYPSGAERRHRKLGGISLGVLGQPGGNDAEFIERRAQFVASKIQALVTRCTERQSMVGSASLRTHIAS